MVSVSKNIIVKTKVEKVFSFIFMSSYAEMSFLKEKIAKSKIKKFFLIG
jgi:hypothetical protein